MQLLIKDHFTIFGFDIYYYAVIIMAGMILGAVITAVLCKRRGIKPDIVLDMMLLVIPLAIIGARLYYVLFALDEFHSFYDVINIRSGGLAIYGGVIGGALGVFIICRIKKLPFLRFADCVVVGLILGQAIGRWGNFINQEAYGNLVTDPGKFGLPWSVYIDDMGAYYQATFFYESMWNVLGTIGLFLFSWFYRHRANGTVMCGYFIWYGIGRTMIEGLRSDSLYIGSTGIRVSQALSIGLIVAGAALAAWFLVKYYVIDKKKKLAEQSAEDNQKIDGEE